MAEKMSAPVRRRNAANTREAILASARTAFTKSGYDGAGVREIASGAGVTAMLVNRYFGSKEQLFAEVVARTMAVPVILTPEILESGNPGEAIAEALVDLTRTRGQPARRISDHASLRIESARRRNRARADRERIIIRR